MDPEFGGIDTSNPEFSAGTPDPQATKLGLRTSFKAPLFSKLDDDSKRSQLLDAMVRRVEAGTAPSRFFATTPDKKIGRPICMYPGQLTYRGKPT